MEFDRNQNQIIKTDVNKTFLNLGEPVYVNVYSLRLPNGLKLGAYHTGTVVYDKEFGFCGHPFPTSGIFETTPMDLESMGEDVTFKEKLYMGRTYLSKRSVDRLLTSLADEFRGDAYHLLHYNCNHFTSHFVQLLCHGTLPSWVNRLARFAANLPFIESMLPPQWVRPSLMYDSAYDYDSEDDENGDEIGKTSVIKDDEKEEIRDYQEINKINLDEQNSVTNGKIIHLDMSNHHSDTKNLNHMNEKISLKNFLPSFNSLTIGNLKKEASNVTTSTTAADNTSTSTATGCSSNLISTVSTTTTCAIIYDNHDNTIEIGNQIEN